MKLFANIRREINLRLLDNTRKYVKYIIESLLIKLEYLIHVLGYGIHFWYDMQLIKIYYSPIRLSNLIARYTEFVEL